MTRLDEIEAQMVGCMRCPRLVWWREESAAVAIWLKKSRSSRNGIVSDFGGAVTTTGSPKCEKT